MEPILQKAENEEEKAENEEVVPGVPFFGLDAWMCVSTLLSMENVQFTSKEKHTVKGYLTEYEHVQSLGS